MIRVDRDTLFKFLRRITKELNHKFVDLKTDFERSPPPPNEIKKRFMEWRSKYDQIVITTLKELLEVDEKTFSFKDFMVKATEENGTDQEFLDLLKGVNGAIETLKDFIRTNLIRDPTIYQIRD